MQPSFTHSTTAKHLVAKSHNHTLQVANIISQQHTILVLGGVAGARAVILIVVISSEKDLHISINIVTMFQVLKDKKEGRGRRNSIRQHQQESYKDEHEENPSPRHQLSQFGKGSHPLSS